MKRRSFQLITTFLFCVLAASGQTLQRAAWEPIVEMEGQLFPSYIFATATRQREENDPHYLGDPDGFLGMSIVNPAANSKLRLQIKADPIAEASIIEGVLAKRGEGYELFPKINYRYDVLQNIRQPLPVNVTFAVYINDALIESRTKVVTVRPINECPTGYYARNGVYVDLSWMFAAYVTEDHPWIDQLLREALNTRLVNRFSGYQGSPDEVYRQVFAVWNVLQRRGFRYSSITQTSSVSNKVKSQYVRFLDDSIRTSQSNCVDGSVVFASILRRIGIDPFLVLIPGHCFVGFYLDAQHRQHASLETTMMGNTDLARYSQDGGLSGDLSKLFGYETKNQASWKSFLSALNRGAETFNQNLPNFRSVAHDNPYKVIDIRYFRESGVAPIYH